MTKYSRYYIITIYNKKSVLSFLKNLSLKNLLLNLKKEQENKALKNKEKIDNYNKKNKLFFNTEYKYDHEKEIVFMIKNHVSLKFITNYFKIDEKIIKDIALRHRCQSQLLSAYTENINARCFSKSQITRVCEEFNYICPMCFKTLDITNIKSLTGHHIQPYAMGGKTSIDNCLPLHTKCHFDEFKILHSALFDSNDPIYSAKYFNSLKERLMQEKSGMDEILKKHYGAPKET